MEILKVLVANWDVLLAGVIGTLSGVIAIALVIPGDQPEKSLQKAVDFLSKFSKK